MPREAQDRRLKAALRRADETLRKTKRCEEKIRSERSTHQHLIKGTFSQYGH